MNRRKPTRRPEQMLQRACVQLLEAFYEPMPDVFWTAINPVPAKSKAVAGVSKAMGMKAGVPDMVFICTDRVDHYHYVTFFEFKAGKGKLSPAQEKLKLLFSNFRPPIHMCEIRSIEQFVAALEEIGLKPRRKLTLRGSFADSYLTKSL